MPYLSCIVATMVTGGWKVLLQKLGETPEEAIAQHFQMVEDPGLANLVPGRGEVLVSIARAAVSWVDLLMAAGYYHHGGQLPYCPGLEYSGTICALGQGTGALQKGQKVLVDPFLAGPRTTGAYQSFGGFASHALSPVEAIVPLPETLTLSQGACLLGSYETAYYALVERARVKAGEWVLLHGASGAVGMAALQIAKHLGAKVIVTGRSDDKLQRLSALGADEFIKLKDDDFTSRVKAICPKGVDVVFDTVGGGLVEESLRAMAFGGRYAVVGWAATPRAGTEKSIHSFPANLVLLKAIELLGCPAAISATRNPLSRLKRRQIVLAGAKEGWLTPHVSKEYDFANFGEALLAKWSGDHLGNVVLCHRDPT